VLLGPAGRDRGVHVSAQDGRALSGAGAPRARRSEEAAAGLLSKRGMFRFGNY
jgi:hypothetical protein